MTISTGFLSAAETRGKAVRTIYGDPSLSPLPYEPYYANLLRRKHAPAQSQIDYWVNSNTLDLFSLEQNIAASDEYFNVAQTLN
jgi:hypothetical protein